MRDLILIIDVLSALGIIGLVLLQQGKGADMGSGFGAGASQTLFGARGSANFLTRTTAVLATVFFVANLALAWMASRNVETPSVADQLILQEQAPESAPAEAAPGGESVPEVPN